MPLIVEDGSRVAGANTYADVATVDAYHAERGNADWTGEDATKEAAILRAMTYIEGLSWRGVKATQAQLLEWPRGYMEDRNGYAINSDVVPTVVVHALCEAALRELVAAGATMPDASRDDVLNSMEIAGAIKMAWSQSAPTRTDFPIIKTLLKGLIAPSGGARLVR